MKRLDAFVPPLYIFKLHVQAKCRTLKPSCDEGIVGVLRRSHLGDAVADLDAVRDPLMLRVRRVPGIGHNPLVDLVVTTEW